jgi:hypothetical protein
MWIQRAQIGDKQNIIKFKLQNNVGAFVCSSSLINLLAHFTNDLCHLLKNRGWKCCFIPDYRIFQHLGSLFSVATHHLHHT